MENIADEDMVLYYQVDYIFTDVPDDAAYFHAQFRRINPLPYKTGLCVRGWYKRSRAIRGNLYGMGCYTTMVGGARVK